MSTCKLFNRIFLWGNSIFMWWSYLSFQKLHFLSPTWFYVAYYWVKYFINYWISLHIVFKMIKNKDKYYWMSRMKKLFYNFKLSCFYMLLILLSNIIFIQKRAQGNFLLLSPGNNTDKLISKYFKKNMSLHMLHFHVNKSVHYCAKFLWRRVWTRSSLQLRLALDA